MFLALYYLYQLLPESIATRAKLRSLKWLIPKTPLLLYCICSNIWIDNAMFFGPEQETGIWLLPCRWHIPSVPLEACRWISAETCGLDDVSPPDDLGSGPYTKFIIIFEPWFSVIGIGLFQKTYTYQELAWLWRCVGWCDCCIVQDLLYHNMDTSTMHWSAASNHSLLDCFFLVFFIFMGIGVGVWVFSCLGSLCNLFTSFLIKFYLIMRVVTIIEIRMAIRFNLNYMFRLYIM